MPLLYYDYLCKMAGKRIFGFHRHLVSQETTSGLFFFVFKMMKTINQRYLVGGF